MINKIKHLIAAAALLILAGCTKPDDDKTSRAAPEETSGLCGETLRITNGTTCEDLQQTSIALLQLDLYGLPGAAICTGTLITPSTILTAAHCLDPHGGVTGLIAGFPKDSHSNKQDFEPFQVARFKMHPKWDSIPGNPYDIGIVVLKNEVGSRAPIPLVGTGAHRAASGDPIGIYGYGKNENGELGTLRYGRMLLEVFDFQTNYSDDLLAAAYDSTGQTICNGDSGGPAGHKVGNNYGIIGVNSIGTSEKCSAGDVSGFANVQLDDNLNFILQEKEGTLGIIGAGGIQYF